MPPCSQVLLGNKYLNIYFLLIRLFIFYYSFVCLYAFQSLELWYENMTKNKIIYPEIEQKLLSVFSLQKKLKKENLKSVEIASSITRKKRSNFPFFDSFNMTEIIITFISFDYNYLLLKSQY